MTFAPAPICSLIVGMPRAVPLINLLEVQAVAPDLASGWIAAPLGAEVGERRPSTR